MGYHVAYDAPSKSWRLFGGEADPVDHEITPLEERRMIFIPAVPSSGTSMVAGVLDHLGVNMGNHRSEQWTRARGYEQFEDLDIGMFTWKANGPQDHLLNQRIRFRDYMNYRFMTQEGRLGVKTLPTVWIDGLYVEAWPLDVLDVRRPMETVLERDIERLARRPERTDEFQPVGAFQTMQRYGAVAAMHWAREMLLRLHPPKYTVEYEDFRANAPDHIEKIVEIFGLEPNDRQMTAALLSVR